MNNSEIDNEIQKLTDSVNKLKAEKINNIMSEITKDLVEGNYYSILDIESHLTVYFKYNKDNFTITDGTGTIGYDGSCYITIKDCLFETSTKTVDKGGYIHNYRFDARKLAYGNSIFGREIEPISEEEHFRMVNRIMSKIN